MRLGPVAADPYPWPWDGSVDGERLALVVAGWDTHWRARSGSTGYVDAVEQRLAQVACLVVGLGGAVLTVHHEMPPRAPRHWPEPRPLDVVAFPREAVAVGTPAIDAFRGGFLEARLRHRGLTHLLVAGHGIEAPVHSTLRSANDRGYECLLLADACSALTFDAAQGALCSVTMSGGIFGAVADCASVLAAGTTDPAPTDPAPTDPDVPDQQEIR